MSEYARVKKLESLQIIGTRGTGAFYSIVELAAANCHAQYSAFTLIDASTRWFYAGVGVDRMSTARQGACCELALATNAITILEDLDAARAEKRVVEADFPEWRSYAAVPIVLGDGAVLGALFVADDQPRTFSDKEINALVGLAGLTVENLRFHETLLRQQQSMLDMHTQAEMLETSNAALARSQSIIELASKTAEIGFWSKPLDDDAFELSPSLQRVLANGANEQADAASFFDHFDGEASAMLRRLLADAEGSGKYIDVNLPLKCEDGDASRWMRVTGRVNSADRRIDGCVQNVTELLESRNKASRIAMLDTLTGAYNRRFLPVAFMRKKRALDLDAERLIVMTIDLDNFKMVNDIHGHDVGDQVLVDVADLLRVELRGGDVIARLGGDEFLAIATVPADGDMGATLGERLRAAAAANPKLNGFAHPVTMSIGYCDASAKDVDFATALKRSDLAVYDAKRGGRNCCVGYEEEMGAANLARSRTLRGVELALKNDEFAPYYQPKVDIATGRMVGAEVLARWLQPDGAVLAPGSFYHALEDANSAARISERIFMKAAADIGALARDGVATGRVGVNVSEVQMVDPGFPDWLSALCDAHGAPLDRLEIEITERCLLSRGADKVRANMVALRDRNVTIAFDDFGTGYASMTHLLEFKTDTIKIDRSFTQRLATDAAARGITGAMIHLAKSLELDVVAEGVETAAEEEALASLGCAVAQGFYYARPMPLPAFADFARERSAVAA